MNELLRFLPDKIQVVAGNFHTVTVSDRGDVYAWGWNGNGQLGTGNRVNHLVPVKVQLPEPISMIAAGNSHTLAVTDNGDVYAWGENEYGQLGIGCLEDQLVPVKVRLPEPINVIAA